MEEGLHLTRTPDYWLGSFTAMASPCQLYLQIEERAQAGELLRTVYQEARRIERKYSRYRDDNIVHQINHSDGKAVTVDKETVALLEYARHCHRLSEGRFDITSGVLRRVWRFDGSNRLPTQKEVSDCLKKVGWHRLSWQPPKITLASGMEIDLGGIGKEYAVDRAALLVKAHGVNAALINFGGDLRVLGPRLDGRPWQVALDDPRQTGQALLGTIEIASGAIATSGDSRRHILHKGKRYSHVLDPRTGWPVPNPPRSVSVKADTCMEAGMLATFAMLSGDQALDFLDNQDCDYWLFDEAHGLVSREMRPA